MYCRRFVLPGLFLAAALVSTANTANADPVVGKQMTVRQPNGTELQVRVWGDEFHCVVESLDGYTLVRDPVSGFGCYAVVSADGNELLSTGVPAGDPRRQALNLTPHVRMNASATRARARASRAAMAQAAGGIAPAFGPGPRPSPMTGNVQGICLLIDFSDEPATIPVGDVDNFCNQVGYSANGNNGSVRDYFDDISNGALTYTNYVPATYYRATKPKSYYDDPNVPFGPRVQELAQEALAALDAGGFDFSLYDADTDGYVDALNFFYAGPRGGVWGAGLWPHSWVVDFSADGVSTSAYQISDMDGFLTLATFCHENGHMLCDWPDLYDYDDDSAGVGRFCIMCWGTTETNPCEPCAYLKYIAGWSTTTDLTTPQTGLSVTAGSNSFFRYPHPTLPNEYYLVENRQQTGRDAGIPDAGLAIWHVDTNGDNDHQDMTPSSHYLVTLVQADGDWDLENNRNGGDSTDLYDTTSYDECSPFSNPDTDWWAGESSELDIYNISASGATMTFSYRQSPDCNDNGVADSLDISGGGSSDCNTNGVPDECEAGLLPQVDTQPTSSDICVGGSATLTVAASGMGPLTYQWYRDGTPIGGATASSYAVASATVTDDGEYEVDVTNTCGTTTSTTVTLGVHADPVISQPPQSQTPSAGSSMTLSVTATGKTPLTYQWYHDGQAISGATGTSVAVPFVTTDDAGEYEVRVDSPCGTNTSPAATVTVMPAAITVRYPANGAAGIPVDPTLSWNPLLGATSYTVRLGMTSSPPTVGTTVLARWTPEPLEYGATYYWQVVAHHSSGSVTGPRWSFTTSTDWPQPPSAPAAPDPADGAVGVPWNTRLTWLHDEVATAYELSWGTERAAVEAGFNRAPTTLPHSEYLTLQPDTKYYWRVWAINSVGTAVSPVWSFTTGSSSVVGGVIEETPIDGEDGEPGDDPIRMSGCPTLTLALFGLAIAGMYGTSRRRTDTADSPSESAR